MMYQGILLEEGRAYGRTAVPHAWDCGRGPCHIGIAGDRHYRVYTAEAEKELWAKELRNGTF